MLVVTDMYTRDDCRESQDDALCRDECCGEDRQSECEVCTAHLAQQWDILRNFAANLQLILQLILQWCCRELL